MNRKKVVLLIYILDKFVSTYLLQLNCEQSSPKYPVEHSQVSGLKSKVQLKWITILREMEFCHKDPWSRTISCCIESCVSANYQMCVFLLCKHNIESSFKGIGGSRPIFCLFWYSMLYHIFVLSKITSSNIKIFCSMSI